MSVHQTQYFNEESYSLVNDVNQQGLEEKPTPAVGCQFPYRHTLPEERGKVSSLGVGSPDSSW